MIRTSVNFVMRADCLQKDRIFSVVLHDAEDNAAVVACTACPRAFQFALQLMSLQAWVGKIGRHQTNRVCDVGRCRGIFGNDFLAARIKDVERSSTMLFEDFADQLVWFRGAASTALKFLSRCCNVFG